jgi:homoserine kinase type II
MPEDPSQTIQNILKYYDLGELADYEKNERGYCNVSFAIQTQKNDQRQWYFFRQYKSSICEDELHFEHSLIQHLVSVGRPPVARVHHNRQGSTYVRQPAEKDECRYFAIFDYLHGEDRYTWINPHCSPTELTNSAATLAAYHQAVWNFHPQGKRQEPCIAPLLEKIGTNLQTCLSSPALSGFHPELSPYHNGIQLTLQKIAERMATLEHQLFPRLVIHCDFHPGNLKFQGDQVVGLFDFDWSKLDYRLFDLALALFYFCTEWEGERDGELRLEEAVRFFQAYQHSLNPGSVPPLSTAECSLLPEFIEAANLYVLNWSIEDILHKPVDEQEYCMYLRHGVRTWIWLNQNENKQRILKALNISSAR